MADIFMDTETVPSQLPWVRDELLAAVKAPGNYSKPESIEKWLEENREKEAEAAWLKTSFDGALGQLVCISWAVDDEETVSVQAADLSAVAEAALLRVFFDAMRAIHSTSGMRPVLIGHNHVAFDLPFIWKRACVHNIKPPFWFPRNVKPWADSIVDTMMLWDSTQRAGGSMERLCRVLGIPGKDGMSGADVWPMVQAGRIDDVAAYCRDDVSRTRAMYRRLTFAGA